MDIVIRLAISSFLAAIFLGWILYLTVSFVIRLRKSDDSKKLPSIKRQLVYSIVFGIILWVAAWLFFLANVKMH